MKTTISLILLIFVCHFLFSQEDIDKSEFYQNYDNIINLSKQEVPIKGKQYNLVAMGLYKLDYLNYDYPDSLANSIFKLANKAYKEYNYFVADSIVIVADTLFSLTNNKKLVLSKILISKISERTDNYIRSEKYGNIALELSNKSHDTISYYKALLNMSNLYYLQGKLLESINIDFELVKIHEKRQDSLRLTIALSNIAKTYTDLNDYTNALLNYNTALVVAEIINDSISIGDICNDLGTIYYHQKNFAEARLYLEKAIIVFKKINDPIYQAGALINYGDLQIAEGHISDGINTLFDALEILNENNDTYFFTNLYTSLGNAYHTEKKFTEAAEYYKKALKSSIDNNNIQQRKRLLQELYISYENSGDYKNAFTYLMMHNSLKDSLENIDIKNQLNLLQTEYNSYKKEQEIINLNKEKELQKIEFNLLVATIFIIVFVFFIITILILLKRKKDKEIHRQKELYHKKEKELTQSKLEKSQMKEEELQQSIIYKSKQLSTHALHMMQKNSMLQEMQDDLKTLAKRATTNDKGDFKRINLQINQSLRSHKDWDVFKLYFEDVNRSFYKKLNKINPDLTTNDHRLCALIKLNMNSKEMASVLNVAPNSIKSSRYRLKKKLGLDVEVDLEEFIRGL